MLCFEVNSFSHREAHRSTEKENPISKYLIISVGLYVKIVLNPTGVVSVALKLKVFKYLGKECIASHNYPLQCIEAYSSDWGG